MSLAQALLPEFDHEMATTRALLERIPAAQAAWRPYPTATDLGALAAQLVALVALAPPALRQVELRLESAAGGGPPVPPSATLAAFDVAVRAARAALLSVSDADLLVTAALKHGDEAVEHLPRLALFRAVVLSPLVHRRGQLSVYLRLLDVPLPAIYGPSADTQ